jgi:hypothetical protein
MVDSIDTQHLAQDLFTAMDHSTAVLRNGLGDYRGALEAAQRADGYDEIGFNAFHALELIEAATRSDRRDLAVTARERLCSRAQAMATNWAMGSRGAVLLWLPVVPKPDDLYRESITG